MKVARRGGPTGGDRTLLRFRAICLSFPETRETTAWGHPNFKAGSRTFAAYEWFDGRPSIALRLDPVDVGLLVAQRDFFVTPYGRGTWASVHADRPVDWRLVEHLVGRAYRRVALKRMLTALEAAGHRVQR